MRVTPSLRSPLTLARDASGALTLLHLHPTPTSPRPLRVDLASPAALSRYASLRRSNDALLRAVGAGAGSTVLDATAGWGRDASALACLAGARVIMVERHPVAAALLADGLRRARAADVHWAQEASLALLVCDGAELLQWLTRRQADGSTEAPLAGEASDAVALAALVRPDVVYLDPMFAASTDGGAGVRPRTAAPQRALAYLAELVGPAAEDETQRLLDAAIGAARRRVVVKRHHGALCVGGGRLPSHCVHSGKATVRYDVYNLT